MRLTTIAALVALSLHALGCKPTDASGPAVASATPSASAAASAVASAPAPAVSTLADGCARAPHICGLMKPGPYSPPPDDAKATPAVAPTSSAAAPAAPRKLGTIDDWVKAYSGEGSADNKKPPRLGVLADIPDLPRTTLAFVRSTHIVRVDYPGGIEKTLTTGPSSNGSPRWTRDARFIFFLSNRDGGVEKIFRMRADGSGVEAISKGIRAEPLSITWTVSDDGAHVAYVPGDLPEVAELHLVDVATKVDEVAFRDVQFADLGFSRDGKTLFVVHGWSEPPGTEHPRTMSALDVATHAVKKLPSTGVTEITSPQELADGRLLFVASSDFSMAGREPRMHVMPKGGGAWADINPLSAPAGYLHPVPSPDGKRLAVGVSMRQGGFGADWLIDVEVVPFDAGPARWLTPDFPRPFYSATSPTWATDSRHLAFELSLCPYVGCDPTIRSVVLVDTTASSPKLAFVGYGGSPQIAPISPPP